MPRGRPKKVIEATSETIAGTEGIIVVQPDMDKTEIKPDYTLEVIRDFYGNIDPTYLSNKNPDFEYRWLNSRADNVTLKTGNLLFNKAGWQLCPREHLFKIGIKEKELNPEGYYQRNELILAFMPKSLYLEKEAHKKRQADAPMNMINRLLKKGSKEAGESIHPTMKGLQTASVLGFTTKEE